MPETRPGDAEERRIRETMKRDEQERRRRKATFSRGCIPFSRGCATFLRRRAVSAIGPQADMETARLHLEKEMVCTRWSELKTPYIKLRSFAQVCCTIRCSELSNIACNGCQLHRLVRRKPPVEPKLRRLEKEKVSTLFLPKILVGVVKPRMAS